MLDLGSRTGKTNKEQVTNGRFVWYTDGSIIRQRSGLVCTASSRRVVLQFTVALGCQQSWLT